MIKEIKHIELNRLHVETINKVDYIKVISAFKEIGIFENKIHTLQTLPFFDIQNKKNKNFLGQIFYKTEYKSSLLKDHLNIILLHNDLTNKKIFKIK